MYYLKQNYGIEIEICEYCFFFNSMSTILYADTVENRYTDIKT